MVTAAVMSQFRSGKDDTHTSGQDDGRSFGGGFKQIPTSDRLADNTSSSTPNVPMGDAPFSATESDQGRSLIAASHTAHHFYYLPPTQDIAGFTEVRSLEESSRDENAFEDPRVHSESSQPLQDQLQYPTSPMVTPPTRVYQSANAARAPQSYSNFSKQGSPKKSVRTQNKDTRPVFSHPVEGVPHVYNDYSQIPLEDETYIRKKTGGVTQPFPEKLHEMLSAVEGTEHESIVSWLPHGRAFIVRKPKEFTDVIMPK
jgi:HSF-type DNA-binding